MGVITPSPLNLVSAKILTVSELSSTLISCLLGVFKLASICFAESNKILPSSVRVLIADNGKD